MRASPIGRRDGAVKTGISRGPAAPWILVKTGETLRRGGGAWGAGVRGGGGLPIGKGWGREGGGGGGGGRGEKKKGKEQKDKGGGDEMGAKGGN